MDLSLIAAGCGVTPVPSDAGVGMFADVLCFEVPVWRTDEIIGYQQVGDAA
jgi:hypothetical protein